MKLKSEVNETEFQNLRTGIIIDNIRRGKTIAIIMIVFELVFMAIDLISLKLKVDDHFSYYFYLIMYFIMILINSIYLLLTKSSKELNEKNLKKLELGFVIYLTLIMSWGSFVSLMDQRLYGQLMVFMVNMITCSVLYFLTNKQILIPYVSSALIVYIGLPFFQKSKDVLIGHYVNLSVFIVISWFASRIVYQYYCNDHRIKSLLNESNALLEKEIDQNRMINMKLAEANLQLKELALIDELTEIPNRRGLRNFVDVAFKYYLKKEITRLCVIMIDIDYFKQYNDNYGHNEGDNVLKAVAQQINAVIKHSKDFVARWGGEEFIYASFDSSDEEISEIAERIRTSIQSLKIPHKFSEASDYVSVSIGTSSIIVGDRNDVSTSIELADKALYSAKQSGRNCVKNSAISEHN